MFTLSLCRPFLFLPTFPEFYALLLLIVVVFVVVVVVVVVLLLLLFSQLPLRKTSDIDVCWENEMNCCSNPFLRTSQLPLQPGFLGLNWFLVLSCSRQDCRMCSGVCGAVSQTHCLICATGHGSTDETADGSVQGLLLLLLGVRSLHDQGRSGDE